MQSIIQIKTQTIKSKITWWRLKYEVLTNNQPYSFISISQEDTLNVIFQAFPTTFPGVTEVDYNYQLSLLFKVNVIFHTIKKIFEIIHSATIITAIFVNKWDFRQ